MFSAPRPYHKKKKKKKRWAQFGPSVAVIVRKSVSQ